MFFPHQEVQTSTELWLTAEIFILIEYTILSSRYGQNDYVQKKQVAYINNQQCIKDNNQILNFNLSIETKSLS